MTDVHFEGLAFLIEPDALIRRSLTRLLRDDYNPSSVLRETQADAEWPGDLVGRLLLTFARFQRAGIDVDERCNDLRSQTLRYLDEHIYFGPPLSGSIHEAQVAGQGWLVAALLQLSLEPNSAEERAALRIVDQLMLPALARLDTYPDHRPHRPEAGGPSGTSIMEIDGWQLSSDTWAILLVLNALVPAAVATGRRDIRESVESLARRLDKIDVVGQQAQLHATMAAARCFSDYAKHFNDPIMWTRAHYLFDLYRAHAQTLNFAAFNWFGRPEGWVEPCAIVDILGLAANLRDYTQDVAFNEVINRTLRNGLAFAQRPDGSFGLDSIATPASPVLRTVHPDARWCCTIRGALGLVEAQERSMTISRGGRVVIIWNAELLLAAGKAQGSGWELAARLRNGHLEIRVRCKQGMSGLTLKLAGRRAFTVRSGRVVYLDVRRPEVIQNLAPGKAVHMRGDDVIGQQGPFKLSLLAISLDPNRPTSEVLAAW